MEKARVIFEASSLIHQYQRAEVVPSYPPQVTNNNILVLLINHKFKHIENSNLTSRIHLSEEKPIKILKYI